MPPDPAVSGVPEFRKHRECSASISRKTDSCTNLEVARAKGFMRWIDPPSGWKYGFPKPFDADPGQAVEDWLLGNGYPQSEIDQWHGRGVPCRIWGEPESDPLLLMEAKILCRVRVLARSQAQAERWYRSQPIPALGGRTAENIVNSGNGEAVIAYIEHLSLGGFA